MASSAEIVASILNLSETDFFCVDETELAKREFEFVDLDFWGVVVNAPSMIQTDKHEQLPLFIASRYSGERGWDVPLKDNCILVSTNFQDGSVRFRKALVSERELQGRWHEPMTTRGPKPAGLPIRSAGVRKVDARQRMGIEWDTGSWSLGVINYDWPSNAVVVDLVGEKDRSPSFAMPVSPELSISGDTLLPSYLRMSKTPPTPEKGLDFTGEFSIKDDEQQLIFFGSFTVSVRDYHLPQQKRVHKLQEGVQQNIAAVVPLTLAVLGLDWDAPLQFDWAVPVYGEPLAVGMVAHGCFAIDAFGDDPAMELEPGKYLCYIIFDGQTIGPKTLEVS